MNYYVYKTVVDVSESSLVIMRCAYNNNDITYSTLVYARRLWFKFKYYTPRNSI